MLNNSNSTLNYTSKNSTLNNITVATAVSSGNIGYATGKVLRYAYDTGVQQVGNLYSYWFNPPKSKGKKRKEKIQEQSLADLNQFLQAAVYDAQQNPGDISKLDIIRNRITNFFENAFSLVSPIEKILSENINFNNIDKR